MPKGKKQNNYIIMVTRVRTGQQFFLESISYTKQTFKLVPLSEMAKAKTYASPDTVQRDIDYIQRCDMNILSMYDTPANWKLYFEQRNIMV